ncbi:NAD(P)-binding protein [Rhizobium sp. P38BS-XIX]|uniref:NAD(P)-binding protein n=1 Tax=Rhizobium sp. P38BS-XIX TaxID=2726740 RepID=UPI0014569C1C|nr:NAD(P)-binding protein [Rhizobium sp. P38BS-XIX]NLR97176.1 NAD(P)-binding protein [Rhizobium sp. P38BS-XIX]
MPDNIDLAPSHLLHGKSVLIVGGGRAGLTLARPLETQGVTVRVFERDAGPGARTQGGGLPLAAIGATRNDSATRLGAFVGSSIA